MGESLRVPPDVVKAECARYRQHGKPWHRSRLQNLDDYDIVRVYAARIPGRRGLLPARPGRLAAALLARRDIDAELAGRQAPVHRLQDGRPPPGQGHHRRQSQDLLRGQAEAENRTW